jgi:formamidopyrimidine-DNA glycosylase
MHSKEQLLPELPEVETTRRGISPILSGSRVRDVIIRQKKLRWPIPASLRKCLPGNSIDSVDRRGKYLLLACKTGTLIIHLGMSGSLRFVKEGTVPQKHDHVDIVMNDGMVLRYTDPRRFGCMLFEKDDIKSHPLLCKLGPEPLGENFDATYLFGKSRGRSAPIKAFVMDSNIVVGVGNIYANEALFMAGINPKTKAGRISIGRYERLVQCIKTVLKEAITRGGTTLKDFTDSEGKPGYFSQQLQVYGREGEPCMNCGNTLKEIRQAQRSTVYCPHCQR